MKDKIILLLVIFGICFQGKIMAEKNYLIAGTAKVNITPPNPKYPVHDSLYARSLVLESNGTSIAFVSVDLGNYNNIPLTELLKKKYGFREVFFCPSHTHSGQAGQAEWLEAQITKVVDTAVKNRFEARISGGHRSFPQLGFNRLIIRDDGWAREPWKADEHYHYINKERIPFGPVDPAVGVLKVEDIQGNPRVIVMNYACHTDAVWGNFAISADWVGVATRLTEEAFDKKVNCLFVNGGAGNIAPLFKDPGRNGLDDPRDTDYTLIERMGKLLSIETVKLAKELRYNPEDIAGIKVKTDSLIFTGRFDKTLRYNVCFSTILINNSIAIATCPGEPFIKFQLDWKTDIGPYATPFFFGYTWNGGKWPIYIPDIRSAALGGYGADMGVPLIEVGSGEAIMNKHLENFYILNGRMRSIEGPTD